MNRLRSWWRSTCAAMAAENFRSQEAIQRELLVAPRGTLYHDKLTLAASVRALWTEVWLALGGAREEREVERG